MNLTLVKSKKACIACGSKNFANFYTHKREFELIGGDSITFNQSLECCYACGLVRQEENESYSDRNLGKYYQSTYRTPLRPDGIDKNDKRSLNARQRLKFILKQKKKGTLLEVGFGDGVFLNEATKNFDCTGVDPSEGYSYVKEYLSKKGVKIYSGQLEKFGAKNKYDVVCSFLVLEHIKNPLAFIKQLARHLKPGGILIIEVPDIRRYKHFNSETMLTHEHVYHYDIASLSALAAKLGLVRVDYSNKDISYGFSLIGAFKQKAKVVFKNETDGFETLSIFQEFLDMREKYRIKMQQGLEAILEKAKSSNHTVGIYGTGFLFNFAVNSCGLNLSAVDYLYDDTKERAGKTIEGKQITPLANVASDKPDVVVVFSEMFFDLMKKNVLDKAAGNETAVINIHQYAL